MAETQNVINALKQALRERRVTYAQVASGLGMSEGNVKRMFASERLTLDRIEAICRLLDLELSDLFQMYEDSRQRISQLSIEQEKELMADTRLLFSAVCVRNHLGFDEIVNNYNISDIELTQDLAKLDRLKIIDLLPNNRIKLRIAENFRWIPSGPIESYYEKVIQREFLKDGFDDGENPRLFLAGLLSSASQEIMTHRLRALSNEFNQLHRQDSELALDKRKNIAILVAMREWEFSALKGYSK